MQINIRHERTLSEEYYASSPYTQSIIKNMVGTIPTSTYVAEYNSFDVYNASSPTTKNNIEIYGLVPLNNMNNYKEMQKRRTKE